MRPPHNRRIAPPLRRKQNRTVELPQPAADGAIPANSRRIAIGKISIFLDPFFPCTLWCIGSLCYLYSCRPCSAYLLCYWGYFKFVIGGISNAHEAHCEDVPRSVESCQRRLG